MTKLEKLKQELAEANKKWAEWEEEEKTARGKHALGFNALGEDISYIKNEIEALEKKLRLRSVYPTDRLQE